MESDYLKIEKKALELIARAEQCSAGLSRKLEARGHNLERVAEVIAKLTEQKLIDDSRYARAWLQTRARLTRTPRGLLVGLCSKGISRQDAQAALDAVFSEDGTEFAMLKRYAKKHAKKGDRLKYLLRSEGFSREAINKFYSE